MRPTIAFAVFYLNGAVGGLAFAAVAPWWLSGAFAGCSLVIGLAIRAKSDHRFWRNAEAAIRSFPTPHEVRAMRAHLERSDAMRNATLGMFWGGLSGAAAADASEVLDALVWPGNEVDAALVAIGVALAWLLGTVVTEEDEAAFRPGVAGLGLYLVTAALAVLPEVWVVLPW